MNTKEPANAVATSQKMTVATLSPKFIVESLTLEVSGAGAHRLEERKRLTGIRLTEQLGGSTMRHPPTTIPPSEDRNKCGDLDGLPSTQPACDNTTLATDRAPATHALAKAPMRARPRKPDPAPTRYRRPSAKPNEANAPEGDTLYAIPNAWATPSPKQ